MLVGGVVDNVFVIGVFAGETIEPNRENPNEPIVRYHMVPFRESDV